MPKQTNSRVLNTDGADLQSCNRQNKGHRKIHEDQPVCVAVGLVQNWKRKNDRNVNDLL